MPNRFGRTNHFGGKPSTSDADRSQGSRGDDTSGGRCCSAAPVAGGEAIHRRTPTGAFRNHPAGHARQALVPSGIAEWMRADAQPALPAFLGWPGPLRHWLTHRPTHCRDHQPPNLGRSYPGCLRT